MAVIPVCAPLHATMHQPTRQCTCSGSSPCSQPCSSAKILRPQSVRRATGLILAAASTSSCTTLAKGPAASAGSFALLVTSTVSSTPTRRFAVRTAAYAQPAGDCVPSAALSWYTSSAARAGAILRCTAAMLCASTARPGGGESTSSGRHPQTYDTRAREGKRNSSAEYPRKFLEASGQWQSSRFTHPHSP